MLETCLSLLLSSAVPDTRGELLALRVGRAETISHGTLEHAVILVEGGKIVAIGEDLPIERGIPILDRPEWVVTPGLVNCHSRAGMDGNAGRSFDPELRAAAEVYGRQDVWKELLEAGVTTLGLYPAGSGIPGQAVAIRPHGATAQEMIVRDGVYLQVYIGANPSLKKMLADAFEKVEEYDEKVKKAREKWEKEQEQKKSKSKSKSKTETEKKDASEEKKEEEEKKDEKDENKEGEGQAAQEEKEKKEEPKKEESSDVFVPPEPEAKVKPFVELRDKRLPAVMSISKAADYLHFLDVIGERDFRWSVHVPLRDDLDLYEVAAKLGEKKASVVMTPLVTLQPSTRRERNLPAELARAGAKVVLLPRGDGVVDHERWMFDVGRLVAAGLGRQAALAAVTLEAARVLGLDERLGSLDVGKDANLILWSGDPLEPSSRIQAVMLEGEFVSGEVGR
jgi:flagellar motor protein MotB